MDLRRVLLILAILLFVAAGAASLAPPSEEESETGSTAPTATGSTDAEASEHEPVEVDFAVDAPEGDRERRAEKLSVDPGARVVATISVPSPGQVELEALGRVEPAEPGTPAVFDLLLDRPGSYEAIFAPTEGATVTAGTIVVGDEGEAGSGKGAGGKARDGSARKRRGGT